MTKSLKTLYRCYSCSSIVTIDQISYQCMCFHPEDKIQYRGICWSCEKKTISEWNEKPDFNHHSFTKLHLPSFEYELWWAVVNRNIKSPNYNMKYQNDEVIFSDFEDGKLITNAFVMPKESKKRCRCCH